MGRSIKLIFITFCFILFSFCFIFSNNVKAETEASLTITKANGEYSEMIHTVFYGNIVGFIDEEISNVELLIWYDVQDEYLKGTESLANKSFDITTQGYLFRSHGISPKNVVDNFYVRLYGKHNNQAVYSKVFKYSMLEYLINAKKSLPQYEKTFQTVLNYASEMQTFLNYKTDHLATATWYKLKVENGTFSDGFTKYYAIEGDNITVKANKIDGKVFKHWINKDTNDILSTNEEYTFTQGNGALNLQAVYEDKVISTITFNTDGGSEVPSIMQEAGTPITKPSNPVKEGYTFVGWDKEIPTTMPSENLIINAIWQINKYSITFNTNGGNEIPTIIQDYGTQITKPSDPVKEGFVFVRWDREIPTTMPSENLTINAIWAEEVYTITFDSKGGASVTPIVKPAGAPITKPATPYFEGKSFLGWYEDEAYTTEYVFNTMPERNFTLYAKWCDYEVSLNYDAINAISIHSNHLSPSTYNASAIDTDGNDVNVQITLIGGKFETGGTISVRVLAMGSYDIYDLQTIMNIKVYDLPSISYNTDKDYINTSDILNSTLFNATSVDTFNNELNVSVSIKEQNYQPGELVTIVLTSIDVANNTKIIEIPNIKLYGSPVINRNEAITGIKVTDTINNSLFDVTAFDSFGVQLTTTTSIYFGSKTSGSIITIKSSTTDSKGNSSLILYEIKVYDKPIIADATKKDFKVEDEITLSSLGIVCKDSFNNPIDNVTLELIDGTKTSGSVLTYKVTAVDYLGNTSTKTYNDIRVYGTPSISYDQSINIIKDTTLLTSNLFKVIVKDSFNELIPSNISLYEGIKEGGNEVKLQITSIDKLGNIATEIINNVKVYSKEDISFTYNTQGITKSKLSSNGSEFNAIGTDSFNEPCSFKIEAAEGYTLKGGNKINIYLVAYDKAGNEIRSDVISNIEIYDMPTLEFLKDVEYLDENDNPYSLFSLKDSFGNELLFNVELISGSLNEPGFVEYRITGQDKVKNKFDQIVRYATTATNKSVLNLYENNVLIDKVIVSNNQSFTLPNKYNIPIAWYLGEEIITDTNGNSLEPWNKESGVYRVDITYYEISYNTENTYYFIPNKKVCYGAPIEHPIIEDSNPTKSYFFTYNNQILNDIYLYNTNMEIKLNVLNLNDYSFAYSGSNATISNYKGNDSIIILPKKIVKDGVTYTITSIGSDAFRNCTSLTSITIPSSVTVIGSSAFYRCPRLNSVIFGENSQLTSIGSSAFYNCSSLTSITIPSGVTSIGSDAFRNCSSLTSITILSGVKSITVPSEVTSIGSSAFSGCTSLASITIPSGVTSIGSSAFSGCTNLNSVTFGENSQLTSIGSSAFYNCSSLPSVTIPSGVTSIGSDAFRNCSSLTSISILSGVTSITVPSEVTSIGSYAFYNCFILTSITIPSGVTSIDSSAFYDCTSLNSVNFGENSQLTSIGSSAFYNCRSLRSITIPSGVTSIGSDAFRNCGSLMSITIPSSVKSIDSCAFSWCYKLFEVINNSSLNITKGSTDNGLVGYYALEIKKNTSSSIVNINDYLFYEHNNNVYFNNNVYLVGYIGNDTNLILPENYNGKKYEIYKYAFLDCISLTSITIPSSVTAIDSYAFFGCSLTSITIPSGVTRIGNNAFYGCSKLVEVINNSSLNITKGSTDYGYVGYRALEIKKNTSSSIVNVNDYLFYEYNNNVYLVGYIGNDTNLILPENYNGKTYEIYRYAFLDCISLKSISILSGVTSIDAVAFEGCSRLNSVTFGENSQLTSIGFNAFLDCISLTSITIPSGVTSIYGYAFKGCSSLTSVSIPSSVTSIDDYTFEGCTSLRSIIIPSSVTSIGVAAFKGCSSLTSITIPSGVTSIGSDAFRNCSSLTSITIPSSVTSIGGSAFRGCTSLTSVSIPSSVTSIGDYTFEGCTSLTSITIPSSVTSIGGSAFSGCTSLTSITIPSSVIRIYSSAFKGCSSLRSVSIPSSVTSIDDYTFSGCTSLRSITIPSSVKSIGSSAFFNCSSLTSITIPSSVTSIGGYAFKGCSSLRSITIPSSVKSIDKYAFYECTSLTSITIPSSVYYIGEDAFRNCTSLTIYCEAKTKPSGWESNWNHGRPVVWNYKGDN